MKKVIFVTPDLANGGAERVTAILANELAHRGMTVEVVFMKDGIHVYQLSKLVKTYDFYSEGNRVSRAIHKIFRLRKLMKENINATFIAMLPFETFYTYLASWGLPNKIIYSLRNDPASMKGKFWYLIKKGIYPKADLIVFQTEEAKGYFPEKVRKKGKVIPNPVSNGLPGRFEGERKKEIVTIGRLKEQKNYPLLLHAFAEVNQKYPDWRLRIFGEGELEEELKALCLKLKIGDAVEFCGFQKNVIEEINQSGIFVLASDYEGISNAMLEAMATGIPCICTDCPVGGARLTIKDHKNGLLVPVGNRTRLVNAIMEIIQDPQFAEQLSRKAEETRVYLSAERIAEEWLRIL